MLNFDVENAVTTIEAYLLQSEEFDAVEINVVDDDEEYAIIDITSHQMYIEVRREEIEVGIARRKTMALTYAPGYYAVVSGSYWEPDEPVEHELNQCSNLVEACVELVSFMFRNRLECYADDQGFAQEMEEVRIDTFREIG